MTTIRTPHTYLYLTMLPCEPLLIINRTEGRMEQIKMLAKMVLHCLKGILFQNEFLIESFLEINT